MKKHILFCLTFLLLASILEANQKVVVIKVNSAIGPATKSYIARSISYSEKTAAKAIIIQLNTPGGLLESTREIVQNIITSKVPVIVYVSPSGSRAGSAGVFITLAANIAVMAPSTNIGAAHPVGLDGKGENPVMFDKITNDASAFIRSIADKRKRNAVWAENAVRKSISSTETEAMRDSVINFVSPSIADIIVRINGLYVETSAGNIRINTTDAEVELREPSFFDEILRVISDPNIAYALLMLGIFGMLFELYNPGAILPGIVGGISLILAAYSLQLLPVNYAGLAMIALAIVLFLLEIKIVSHGLLAVGGTISLFLGSVMLFDSPNESMKVSMGIIITVVILSVLFFTVVLTIGLKAQTLRKFTGSEALSGEIGTAETDFNPGEIGKVLIHGEHWKAESDFAVKAGDKVRIIEANLLTLYVKLK